MVSWSTIIAFLDYFGLSDLTDLPGIDELKLAGLLKKGATIGGMEEIKAPSDGNDEDKYDTDSTDFC